MKKFQDISSGVVYAQGVESYCYFFLVPNSDGLVIEIAEVVVGASSLHRFNVYIYNKNSQYYPISTARPILEDNTIDAELVGLDSIVYERYTQAVKYHNHSIRNKTND